MAIFRHGVKIGPFDIRASFPRDTSLDNVEGDVRLTQHANTENTINNFRAMMGRAEGYARPNRFAVQIDLPSNLAKLAADSTIAGVPQLGIADTVVPGNPDAVTMQQLSKEMGEQINIHCNSIIMPGHDLQTTEHVVFGPGRTIVDGHGYEGKIQARFYADKYLRERHFLEMWQKMCVSNTSHKVGYYDDYVGKMRIMQLGSLEGLDKSKAVGPAGRYTEDVPALQDQPTYAIEATEVYPEQISDVRYSYGPSTSVVQITCEFQYRIWYNLTTDAVAGMDYGQSRQTLHDVKGRDRGLFGKLPPELQRVGRGIFNQAKTQLPIGRLTKGKIFAPYIRGGKPLF
jgi:hypothetical protein